MLNINSTLEEMKGMADELGVTCRQKRKGNQDRKYCEDLEYIEQVSERIRLQILQVLKVINR